MRQILVKKGIVYGEDVPAPVVHDQTILVETHYSCISTGTEMANVSSSEQSLLNKVLRQPNKIIKALDTVKTEGLSRAIHRIKENMEVALPLGYSASGVVIEVGSKIKDIQIGDRVACAGAGIANHAENIEVPRNLLVKIPEKVDFAQASTVTLGAIAMQGVRRADVRLGEYVAVIGLGILGQITAQLLQAQGCRVFGADLDERRIKKALELGLNKGISLISEDAKNAGLAFTNGHGFDAVIITTATHSKEPLATAFQICRKKGRVILVGTVGMEINREDIYEKELDFKISTSYGPGRYDELFEQKGMDYPYAYVRWTETRNMEEYIRLIAENKIQIKPLIEKEYNISDASSAYEELKQSDIKPLIVLLKYNPETGSRYDHRVELTAPASIKKEGKTNIALIGAGGFAKSFHLPNLAKLRNDFNIVAIMSKTGSNAKLTAEKYSAKYATTDYREVLEDKNVEAVLIATRHNLHAEMAIKALKAGKAVFLEKPMAVRKDELDQLTQTIMATRLPFMVGFNRRFSKYAQEIKRHVSERTNPLLIDYQMNAGFIPLSHWVHTEEGGGRIIGEACHIFDLFNYFTDAKVESISANCLSPATKNIGRHDNAVISLKYEDGSVCTLTYTALGNNSYPKEACQIFFDNKIIVLNDFKELKGYGVKLDGIKSQFPDKGQYEELIEFAKYVRGEIDPPIPLWQLVQTTEISFKADALL